MKVLVDTCVWSVALRKKYPHRSEILGELSALIKNYEACIIGPIKQALLSGYSDKHKFQLLKESIEAYPNLKIDDEDYVRAAEFCNTCRAKGIQGSNTDFLICSVSHRYVMPIFTLDNDFVSYAKCLPIKLHKSNNSI